MFILHAFLFVNFLFLLVSGVVCDFEWCQSLDFSFNFLKEAVRSPGLSGHVLWYGRASTPLIDMGGSKKGPNHIYLSWA